MTGTGWDFGIFFSLLFVTLVTIVLFGYIWLRSHGGMHMAHAHAVGMQVDSMAGDEGED